MNYTFHNATPQAIHLGFADGTPAPPPVVITSYPIHMPQVLFMAERGTLNSTIGATDTAAFVYGLNTFDPNKKWFSHQTQMARLVGGTGNMCMWRRLIDPDATTATMVLYVEMVKYTFNDYQRNANGSVSVDAMTGEKLLAGTSTIGYKVRTHLAALPAGNSIYDLPTMENGTLEGDPGEVSKIWPIWASQINSPGSYGDNVGLRMFVPHAKSTAPGDLRTIIDQNALMLNMQLVERADAESTPLIQPTLLGSVAIETAFRRDVKSASTNLDFTYERMVSSWTDPESGGTSTRRFGQIGTFEVYEENLLELQTLLSEVEDTFVDAAYTDPRIINPFSALDPDGNEHYGFRMADDTLTFNSTTVHYYQGGSDGDVSSDMLDRLVRDFCEGSWDIPQGDEPADRLAQPFSIIYDTGFGIDTKRSMITTLGKRPDISVSLSTFTHGLDQLNVEEEISMGTALKAVARLFPESVLNGTPVVRATIYGQSGQMNEWDGAVKDNTFSMTMEMAWKRARYFGAASGIVKPLFQYNLPARNRVNIMNSTTSRYMPHTAREELWARGVNYAQSWDRNSNFYAAYQTVYDSDNSPMNSEMVMFILVDLVKQADRQWTLATNSLETYAVFKERNETEFAGRVDGKYGDLATVVPTVFFTPDDITRGYSFSMNIDVTTSVMRTVGSFQITSYPRPAN